MFAISFLYSDPTYEAWKLSSGGASGSPGIIFRSYLWGMETHSSLSAFCSGSITFRSYLWGMETFITSQNKRGGHDSDPTYEAWKLSPKYTYLRSPKMIPILPMRHGNTTLRPCHLRDGTYSDPTYEAWKHINIFKNIHECEIPILPMRHGNNQCKHSSW